MNESSSSRLPVKVHTDRSAAVPSKPLFRYTPPDIDSPKTAHPPTARRHGNLRMGLVCLALAVGLTVALIPAFRAAYDASGGSLSLNGIGQALGQGLLGGGLPPTHSPDYGSDVTETDTLTDTGTEGSTETEPYEPPAESDGERESSDDTQDPTVTGVPGSLDGTVEPSAPMEPTETVAESLDPEPDTLPLAPHETEGETRPGADTDPPETAVPVPDGCYPIVSVDMSEQERGVGYVVGNAEDIPAHLPSGWLWSTDAPPTVLLVNTHPYEGYGDGSAWYDPTAGGLGVTETPNATDGTVALGATLTRALRDQGVTVIHLRVAVSAEDTAAEIYDRTEAAIRQYCRLYPDIGLVVNLRRSAELTEEGGVLRTAGSYRGEPCAQVRISVSGGRSKTATGRDLAVALALREGLWGLEPSISRPVWVKSGGGLVPDLTHVCVLTLEAGSAGNTYAESRRLAEPLAAVLDGLLRDNG